MLSGALQVAQAAGAGVSLEEHDVEIRARMEELKREVSSLENASAGAMSQDREVSYVIL